MPKGKVRKAFEKVNDRENIGMLDHGTVIVLFYEDDEIGEKIDIGINEFNFSDENFEEIIKDKLVQLEKRVTERKKLTQSQG